jgi:hypothetical protein
VTAKGHPRILPQPRQPHVFFLLLTFTFLLTLVCDCTTVKADAPRVSAAYTAWDDYYFYAAFEVTDHNVISTNRTPISQPQEDDDVEVFLNTNPSATTSARAASTYQMAVSAGSGAYFSQGDGTAIPVGKLVLTYKYAVTIDGTLNNPNDNDTGFTVELAIPWQELGLSGPPAGGQTWGLNVISRNRESLDAPAQSFASLSPNVLSHDDIQNPSKWTKIQFITTLANQLSGPNIVYCPRVTSDTQYPVIDGVVRDGEWNTAYGYTFGNTLIAGAAPTLADEPNITQSPFATTEQPVIQTPVTPDEPAPGQTSTTPDYTLALPGGGEIHVGKLRPPPVIDNAPLSSSGLPEQTVGPEISPDASLALAAQTNVAPLILAPYTFTFKPETWPTQLTDQPIDAIGPAFGGDHAQWHKNQLVDARRAGIDVLLPIIDPKDPESTTGLAALVEAMKELEASGQDYPLLGVKVKGSDAAGALREFLTIVPAEFRAEVVLPDSLLDQRAYVLFDDTGPVASTLKSVVSDEFKSPDTVLVTTPAGHDYVHITTVSPGGWDSNTDYTGRQETNTLSASWGKVYEGNANWVYLNSWNDFSAGTEVAPSRQYGEQYVDANRTDALKWAGAEQWDAKYLQNDVPSVVAQKTIYTVSIRIENNGSLPWRSGEDYALSYRWYKDGRLYDDSAPKLPLSDDIYPGESATVKVGLFAQNSFGGDIEPGLYTLVFDMVQGQDRWFSYVGERPLSIPVRVEDQADTPQSQPVVLSSTTPAILDTDGTYNVTLVIRNEGQETWLPSNTSISLTGNQATGASTLDAPVYPGAIGHFTESIRVPANLAIGAIGELDWVVTAPGSKLNWAEYPLIVDHDLGASFAINDVPRTMKTGDTVAAKVAVINVGPNTWAKGVWKIGYEWLYLDGLPAVSQQTGGAFDAEADPTDETAAAVTISTPKYPGKYQLVFDLISPDGLTTLSEPITRGDAVLSAIVTVTDDKNTKARQIDLSKFFNANGIGYESTTDPADFDGQGGSLPAVYIPADGTDEVNVNPLIVGKPGPAIYPSGYYSSKIGDGEQSNHRIGFLYGPKDDNNVVVSNGQTIQIPGGQWKAIHILAASVAATSTTTAQFSIGYNDGVVIKTVEIANWSKIPDPNEASIGLRLPYHLSHGAVVPEQPVFLGDYLLETESGSRVQTLTLPRDPHIKILAITVER